MGSACLPGACRLGESDLFARFSAAGRRNASARVYTRHIGGNGGCPAAVLVGIDVSREPGLAGINFFGSAPAGLLREVDAVLGKAARELRCATTPHRDASV